MAGVYVECCNGTGDVYRHAVSPLVRPPCNVGCGALAGAVWCAAVTIHSDDGAY